MEFIPGLPNDVGLECLIRVPLKQFSSASSVCSTWKAEFQSPEFRQRRKAAGLSERLVVMAQARDDPTGRSGLGKYLARPVYRLSVYEPGTGDWRELPKIPGYPDGLPMFCQLAAVGYNLVVMGGWDPATWEATNAVFVYSFVSGTWQRGADMPGRPRSFFACASDRDRTVFVAGGHDNEKNALKSAMAYDVASDKWALLPDMANERDECKGIFHRGKFQVIGGYRTQMQGRFERSAEAYDEATLQWDSVEEDFLGAATCPRSCMDGGNGTTYMCQNVDVIAFNQSSKRIVAKVPNDVCNTLYVIEWQGHLLAMGSPGTGEPHRAYTFDLKSHTWTKVDVLEEFSGHVQSGCCLEI